MLVMMSHNKFENLPEKEYYYQTEYEKKDLDKKITEIWKNPE